MYYHKIVNAETGEETITELSKAEIKVVEANIVKTNAELEKAEAKIEAKVALLKRLGMTADEAKLLLA